MTAPDGNPARALAGGSAPPVEAASSDQHHSTLRWDQRGTPAAGPADLSPFPAPEIEGYRLLVRLGEGGMGVVWQAEHLALNRVVAIKLIRAGSLASKDDLTRFQIEAEAVARLQHPNIVQIFDYGEQAGLRYLSLEYVSGGTLADRILGRPQPPREAARMVETLARAVHAAHLRGIIHRDLKPANVLLMADGTPKISDFGLAKFTTEDDAAASCMLVGTAGYMAPEQAWGSGLASEIGPEADVYGLGVILYEFLTGQLPFKGSSARETLEQVWTKPAPSPRAFRSEVPRDLEVVCLKCLEKLPHHRYASAAELADDLARYLANEPIHARPAGMLERLAKWSQRRPAIAALWGLALAALLSIAALATFYQIRVNQNFRLAKQNLRQAQNAIDELIQRAGIDGLSAVPRTEGLRRELLESALTLSQSLQASNPDDADLALQSARARRQMGDLYQLLGEPDKAREAYEQASAALARQRGASASRELAVARNNEGNLLRQAGSAKEAEVAYLAAAEIWIELVRAEPEKTDYRRGAAAAENNLGLLLAGIGRDRDAEARLRQAESLRRELWKSAPESVDARIELATTLSNLGLLLRSRGELGGAADTLRESVALLKSADKPSPVARFTLASARNNLGSVESDPAEARTDYEAAVRELELLVADFPEVDLYRQALADTLSNLGVRLADSGEQAAGLKRLEQARQLYHELALQTHSPAAQRGEVQSLARLAQLRAQAGEIGQAQQLSLEGARLGESLVAAHPQDSEIALAQSFALAVVSDLLRERGQAAEARRQLDDALQLARRAADARPSDPGAAQALKGRAQSLAEVLIELGEPAGAMELANEVAERFPNEPAELANSADWLAQCIPLASGLKGTGSQFEGRPIDEYCVDRLRGMLAGLPAAERKKVLARPAFQRLREKPEFADLLGPEK